MFLDGAVAGREALGTALLRRLRSTVEGVGFLTGFFVTTAGAIAVVSWRGGACSRANGRPPRRRRVASIVVGPSSRPRRPGWSARSNRAPSEHRPNRICYRSM
ncbi:hypothetical protein C474_00155 [Halogeometricum pallidum JCM 14848]|uniref:Uncharacterized protein n=1 Tax=Halogeometricum pallidum JCM 14848 TaxID=1227487 RepID=M0DIL7_HALPD|nr:hypothetical protein C474_00155 [Halogeometricum pallidum JCM 14848]